VRENRVEGKQKKKLAFPFKATGLMKESQCPMPCHNVKRCVQAKKGSGWKIWDEGDSLDVDRVWERTS
jgi:hypothetical protein